MLSNSGGWWCRTDNSKREGGSCSALHARHHLTPPLISFSVFNSWPCSCMHVYVYILSPLTIAHHGSNLSLSSYSVFLFLLSPYMLCCWHCLFGKRRRKEEKEGKGRRKSTLGRQLPMPMYSPFPTSMNIYSRKEKEAPEKRDGKSSRHHKNKIIKTKVKMKKKMAHKLKSIFAPLPGKSLLFSPRFLSISASLSAGPNVISLLSGLCSGISSPICLYGSIRIARLRVMVPLFHAQAR